METFNRTKRLISEGRIIPFYMNDENIYKMINSVTKEKRSDTKNYLRK